MEVRQLRHFVAVAEEGSFTRAAARVNIVQSALSTSIRQLEAELDARLFVRTTRQVTLTAAGEAFLEKARVALDVIRQGREAVTETTGLKRGKLGIGTVQSLPAFLDLPALLAAFHARYPDIEVRLLQGSAPHLVEKVRSRELDLAILPITDPPAELSTTTITCENLVLICPPGHRLAGRKQVRLADIAGERFVDFEPAFGTRKLVDQAFSAIGLERRVAFEVSDLLTLLELVVRGLGIAFAPQTIAQARRRELALVPIGDAEICWELVVAHTPQDAQDGLLDAAPRAFLELLSAEGRLAQTEGEAETA
ncbi:LysR family transcriptional regulator [Burkholderia sp. WAC0059]|nr:LysR family transcriptional regulator [Burkholderia sp. WAC0059]